MLFSGLNYFTNFGVVILLLPKTGFIELVDKMLFLASYIEIVYERYEVV